MERERSTAAVSLSLGLSLAPVSIALAEIFLAIALAARFISKPFTSKPARSSLPRAFWFWLGLAFLEIVSWLKSPQPRAGLGEIRHLALIGALFLLLPVLPRHRQRVRVWCGIFAASTLSSLILIFIFFERLHYYLLQPPGSLYASEYLRNGGLLHNWMVYATVEIVALAGLLEFHHFYPQARTWTRIALIIQCYAILVSLTRMLWVSAVVVLFLHLLWRRSRWAWAVPALPAVLLVAAPAVVRARVAESLDRDYYSNAERIQMLRVGWHMVRDHPFAGVGPGRVDQLYLSYLPAGAPVPAYHGHLHNNLAELAAEFGWPTAAAALLLSMVIAYDLRKRCRQTGNREEQFLCRAGLSALIGFLIAGTMDYTYGHSLGLIVLSFAVVSPLIPRPARKLTA